MLAPLSMARARPAEKDEAAPSIGNLFAPIGDYARSHTPELPFLNTKFHRVEQRKRSARAAYTSRLAYSPPIVPFDARINATVEKDGYTQESLVFRTSS